MSNTVKVMTGGLHPVGPNSPSVYWRRRVLLALAVIATLLLAKHELFSSNSSAAAPSTSGLPSVSTSVAVSESATPLVNESTTPAPEPTQQEPNAEPTADGYCADADVSVRVAIDRDPMKSGTGMQLTMKVKNNSDAECLRDVGSGANEITIISGPALIWSTDHCNPSTAQDPVSLKPGKTWKVTVTWNAKLSAKGCQIQSIAKPGAYWAHARNGEVRSDGVKFVVN